MALSVARFCAGTDVFIDNLNQATKGKGNLVMYEYPLALWQHGLQIIVLFGKIAAYRCGFWQHISGWGTSCICLRVAFFGIDQLGNGADAITDGQRVDSGGLTT